MRSHNLNLALGILPFVVAFTLIALSINTYPGFSFRRNALSDLGHATKSPAAVAFNLGLQTAGFLMACYALALVRRTFPLTGWSLVVSAYLLQLVAVFDEVYGAVHFLVSVLLFLSLLAAALVHSCEARSALPAFMGAVGVLAWLAFWLGPFKWGVAVPETVSIAATFAWYVKMASEVASEASSVGG
ncbi:MAG: DUF998 domain-containing protein [Candidatus Korarchaeota archaeon]|nr:DUF998 domain-containing protein [Candidatus Korarchaeota archaeon]